MATSRSDGKDSLLSQAGATSRPSPGRSRDRLPADQAQKERIPRGPSRPKVVPRVILQDQDEMGSSCYSKSPLQLKKRLRNKKSRKVSPRLGRRVVSNADARISSQISAERQRKKAAMNSSLLSTHRSKAQNQNLTSSVHFQGQHDVHNAWPRHVKPVTADMRASDSDESYERVKEQASTYRSLERSPAAKKGPAVLLQKEGRSKGEKVQKQETSREEAESNAQKLRHVATEQKRKLLNTARSVLLLLRSQKTQGP